MLVVNAPQSWRSESRFVITWTRPRAFRHRGASGGELVLPTQPREGEPMNKITAIAIDLAKHVFQVAGENAHGEVVLSERLKSRPALHKVIQTLEPPLTVAIETGPGAQAWAREIQARGVEVKILPAQHTAAHRSGNKNDANDALSILRALHDVSVHPVPVKTQEQLALQALHRARRGWRRRMTAISNQVRGLLLEQGVVMARGNLALVRKVDSTLEDATLPIPDRLRALVAELRGEWRALGERMAATDGELAVLSRTEPLARHLCPARATGPDSRRIQRWVQRCGRKGAAVRLANHNLRVVWLLLKHPGMRLCSDPAQRDTEARKGRCAASCRKRSGAAPNCSASLRSMGVSVSPGQRQLTRMFCGP